jgi:hypothetical protein
LTQPRAGIQGCINVAPKAATLGGRYRGRTTRRAP